MMVDLVHIVNLLYCGCSPIVVNAIAIDPKVAQTNIEADLHRIFDRLRCIVKSCTMLVSPAGALGSPDVA